MSDSEHNQPTYDDIARLAYDRYLARGRAHGFALEDWLAAEQEARLRQTAFHAAGTASSAAAEGAAIKTPRRRRADRNGTRPHRATAAPPVIM